jgi:hypothetical protein
VPYILLVMAAGIVRLVTRARTAVTRAAVAVLLVGLVAAHVASERWYAHRLHSPEDYAGLAAEWKGELRPDDLILVRDHWSSTPILYYISYRTHRFIWHDHAAALAAHPDARAWTLVPDAVPVLDEIRAALRGYEPGETIEVRGIRVRLYTPRRNAGSSAGS